MTTKPATRPLLVNAERAGLELLADKVAAGLISESAARDVFAFGFPFITRQIADWRRERVSAEFITEEFDRRAATAKARGRTLSQAAAEFYAAVWKGMQKDLAAFLSA